MHVSGKERYRRKRRRKKKKKKKKRKKGMRKERARNVFGYEKTQVIRLEIFTAVINVHMYTCR